eukprot:2719161-Rhodomonas_salina.1
MISTEIAYGAGTCYGMSSTEIAYGAGRLLHSTKRPRSPGTACYAMLLRLELPDGTWSPILGGVSGTVLALALAHDGP